MFHTCKDTQRETLDVFPTCQDTQRSKKKSQSIRPSDEKKDTEKETSVEVVTEAPSIVIRRCNSPAIAPSHALPETPSLTLLRTLFFIQRPNPPRKHNSKGILQTCQDCLEFLFYGFELLFDMAFVVALCPEAAQGKQCEFEGAAHE